MKGTDETYEAARVRGRKFFFGGYHLEVQSWDLESLISNAMYSAWFLGVSWNFARI